MIRGVPTPEEIMFVEHQKGYRLTMKHRMTPLEEAERKCALRDWQSLKEASKEEGNFIVCFYAPVSGHAYLTFFAWNAAINVAESKQHSTIWEFRRCEQHTTFALRYACGKEYPAQDMSKTPADVGAETIGDTENGIPFTQSPDNN